MSSEDILTEDQTQFCILACDLVIKVQKLLGAVHRLIDETKCNKITVASFYYFY